MKPRKKRLTRQDLRALGASAGLIVTRYTPDGERATIHQLSPESDERRRSFARRLTQDSKDTPANEEAS